MSIYTFQIDFDGSSGDIQGAFSSFCREKGINFPWGLDNSGENGSPVVYLSAIDVPAEYKQILENNLAGRGKIKETIKI